MIFAFACAALTLAATPVDEPIRFDAKRRPVVSIRIDDRSAVDMLVDTAAQTSLLTQTASAALALPPTGDQVTVNGVAGSVAAPVVAVRRMHNALIDVRDTALIAVANIGVTDAQGILGMDLLQGRRLVFDLTARQVTATGSSAAPAGYVAVAGRRDDKGLLHVPVTIDGVNVDALVDTGAEGSVADAATLRLLGIRDDDPRLKANGTITGAATGGRAVRRATVGRLSLGPVTFRDVPLTFTARDDEKPRLILGMDLLGPMQRFAVDLGRAELQIHVPPQDTRSTTPPRAQEKSGS